MLETVRVERQVAGVRAEEAFDFVLDVESYPRFMPNVNSVAIVEQDGVVRLSHWDTEIEGAPLVWTERDVIDRQALRFAFESIKGDFEIFRGAWIVEPAGDGARIACAVEYSIGIPVIEEIVGAVLKQKITENLLTMLDGLAKGLGQP